MKRFYTLILCLFGFTSLVLAQELLPGIQIDEVNGQTIYTCDADFFDSGGHYIHC